MPQSQTSVDSSLTWTERLGLSEFACPAGVLALAGIGWLWLCVFRSVWLEWFTNPQYEYGLIVPLLCVGLLLRRWTALLWEEPPAGTPAGGASPLLWLGAGACALVFGFARLLEAATPEWRPLQWALAIVAVALTLGVVQLAKGGHWLRHLAFPVCFFLVAVPWPTPLESPVIQAMARFNARCVVEIVDILGVPAFQHGNTIEVASGVVGVDDACSGIRSFQSSIMISLFLGEYYRLRVRWRTLLVALAMALALGFNVIRTSFLTMVAARKGVKAIAQYHDQAGVSILLACVAVTWACAWVLARWAHGRTDAARSAVGGPGAVAPARNQALRPQVGGRPARSPLLPLGGALLAWVVLVEVGVWAWFHHLEVHQPKATPWTLYLPDSSPGFVKEEIMPATAALLRYDLAQQASWSAEQGTRWWGFVCEWKPGRVAGYLAKRHTPEICLQATGMKMVSGPELFVAEVNGIELPIRQYAFENGQGRVQVFHCRWEAGANQTASSQDESARLNLIRSIWAGRGKGGQKVFEFVVSGEPGALQARQALLQLLKTAVRPQGRALTP